MCKLGLSLEEVRTLHGFFDRGGDGHISFDEFLKAIRGSLSPTRRKLVTKVFNALDASGETTLALIEADPFTTTPKPVLGDGDWVALQGICDS